MWQFIRRLTSEGGKTLLQTSATIESKCLRYYRSDLRTSTNATLIFHSTTGQQQCSATLRKTSSCEAARRRPEYCKSGRPERSDVPIVAQMENFWLSTCDESCNAIPVESSANRTKYSFISSCDLYTGRVHWWNFQRKKFLKVFLPKYFFSQTFKADIMCFGLQN